jgi:hypothetical protein
MVVLHCGGARVEHSDCDFFFCFEAAAKWGNPVFEVSE